MKGTTEKDPAPRRVPEEEEKSVVERVSACELHLPVNEPCFASAVRFPPPAAGVVTAGGVGVPEAALAAMPVPAHGVQTKSLS